MAYDVLLTKKDKKHIARVRQWPEIVVEGETEKDVLTKVRTGLEVLLNESRIVQIDLDTVPTKHPWQKFAGMFADDPDWDMFQESIQQYRENVDASFV